VPGRVLPRKDLPLPQNRLLPPRILGRVPPTPSLPRIVLKGVKPNQEASNRSRTPIQEFVILTRQPRTSSRVRQRTSGKARPLTLPHKVDQTPGMFHRSNEQKYTFANVITTLILRNQIESSSRRRPVPGVFVSSSSCKTRSQVSAPVGQTSPAEPGAKTRSISGLEAKDSNHSPFAVAGSRRRLGGIKISIPSVIGPRNEFLNSLLHPRGI